MKPEFAVTAVRPGAMPLAAAIAAAFTVALAGCSSTDGLFGSKVDYKAGATKTVALEVPPDLSQLARDSRYQPQGGVVSAAASRGPRGTGSAGAAADPGAASVAVSQRGELRIERQGQTRWLVVPGSTPDQLWPQVKSFWAQSGFELEVDDAAVGVMETAWSENRAKLPNDIIRNTLGRVLGRLFDSGERDRFRTRLERSAAGTEIFVSHRGLSEEYTNDRKENTAWRPRQSDPQLEAEFLSRLMLSLGAKEEAASPGQVAAAPEAPARARTLSGQDSAALEVDEPFDRAWRRVGLALDRSGFSVEDRDRAGGLYYVRYVDPATVGQEEPAFWQRWFGAAGGQQAPVRYRIAIKATGEKTQVAVQSSAGQPENGANAQRIVGLLVNELR